MIKISKLGPEIEKPECGDGDNPLAALCAVLVVVLIIVGFLAFVVSVLSKDTNEIMNFFASKL